MARTKLEAAWQSGDIDDATFEGTRVRRVWMVAGLLSVPAWAALTALFAAKPRALSESSAMAGIIVGVFGFALALKVARFVRFDARNKILTRNRVRVERDPALPLAPASQSRLEPSQFFGSHRRAHGFAHRLLVLAGIGHLLAAAYFWGYGLHPVVILIEFLALWLMLWGAYLRFDGRPYLQISAEGLWCRRWGDQWIRFEEFKAVYPRRTPINDGVTLVPRQPGALKPKLSTLGRLALSSGDFGGVAAHTNTLTIWTDRLDLPQTEFLLALQHEILRAAGSPPNG